MNGRSSVRRVRPFPCDTNILRIARANRHRCRVCPYMPRAETVLYSLFMFMRGRSHGKENGSFASMSPLRREGYSRKRVSRQRGIAPRSACYSEEYVTSIRNAYFFNKWTTTTTFRHTSTVFYRIFLFLRRNLAHTRTHTRAEQLYSNILINISRSRKAIIFVH